MSGKNISTPGGNHHCGNPPAPTGAARAEILEARTTINPTPVTPVDHLAGVPDNTTRIQHGNPLRAVISPHVAPCQMVHALV